jgi:triosephosphate isomerase
MKPLFVVNFKAYEQATGRRALELAKAIEKSYVGWKDSLSEIKLKSCPEIILAVQPFDLKEIARSVKLPVYSQHLDPIEPGSHTGWILPLAVKRAGGRGTLLNHSEHRTGFSTLRDSIQAAGQLGLKTVACAKDSEEAGRIARMGPDFVAVEPPELIGGKISVSTARPGLVSGAVKKCGSVPVLVGAGVKTAGDVRKATELGARGILVASGVVKAADPGKAVRDMAMGLK